MKIEIKDFFLTYYNSATNTLSGTLKIFLPDLKMFILGINVHQKKDKWIFKLPEKKTWDEDKKVFLKYPILAFSEKDPWLELKTFLHKNGPNFVQEKIVKISKTVDLTVEYKKPFEPFVDSSGGVNKNFKDYRKINKKTGISRTKDFQLNRDMPEKNGSYKSIFAKKQ